MTAMTSPITSLTIIYSNILFRSRLKKTSKLRVTGLYEGNSLVTDEFPAQRASNEENVSIWWRHHDLMEILYKMEIIERGALWSSQIFQICVLEMVIRSHNLKIYG